MSRRDAVIYALAGLGIWLNGAVSFRLGGTLLFHNGPLVIAAVAAGVAILVCLAFRVTFAWRKGRRSQAVTAAVLMALPGLFGACAGAVGQRGGRPGADAAAPS